MTETLPAPSVRMMISGAISGLRRCEAMQTRYAASSPAESGVLPPTGMLRSVLLRQLDAGGGRQHDPRFLALEDDQPHLVAALVGIVQQRDDRALGGLHALGRGHAPRGIHHEEHQVGGPAHAHLLLQVLPLDDERQLALGALARAAALEGRGRAEGGVEGQILRPALTIGRARM